MISSRRSFLRTSALAGASAVLASPGTAASGGGSRPRKGTVDIGSRLELFVDEFLVEKWDGKAELRLHQPAPQEIVLTHDEFWEGNASCNHTIFQDGDRYRMYYRGSHLDLSGGKINANPNSPRRGKRCCYAESDDGIHWRKPQLNLFEYRGSKANNILAPGAGGMIGNVKANGEALVVFKDNNPDATPDARYKAFAVADRSFAFGLLALKSPDGIHWTSLADQPVITKGAFDSMNLAFWDTKRREYRAYYRVFTAGVTDGQNWKPEGTRGVRTATSKDFVHWSDHADLVYEDSPPEQIYNFQIKPYFRAPHLFIGFPMRYLERPWSDSMRALPDSEHRAMRSGVEPRFGTGLTEGLFMSSRDGVAFKRWNEAFLRPGPERGGTWNYAHQLIAWHAVTTRSPLQGAPDELSVYAPENIWTGTGSQLRRYSLRLDGFVSVRAPMSGGELLTRPVIFDGDELVLNFSSSAAGGLRVELQNESGIPHPGFALEDCSPVFGDSLQRTVTWKTGSDLSGLSGRPVRLRFSLNDADLYSIQFKKKA